MRALFFLGLVACSAPLPEEKMSDAAAPIDAPSAMDSALDASGASDANEAGDAGCFLDKVGVFGQCMTTAECAALGKYVSTPGYCPGSSNIECCTKAPNVADNPPIPTGWKLMQQASVTPAMTTWAVAILHDPVTYPMFSTTMKTFGALNVMARVEWHPPDFQNNTIHRGVTLYEPG
jgi:hypothetical protein